MRIKIPVRVENDASRPTMIGLKIIAFNFCLFGVWLSNA